MIFYLITYIVSYMANNEIYVLLLNTLMRNTVLFLYIKWELYSVGEEEFIPW